MYISTYIREKNCHQHSSGFQSLMSSWGLGNTIFEITIFTWVFKYEVPKVAIFLTDISDKMKRVTDFSKISKTWFAMQNEERRNPARKPAKRLIFDPAPTMSLRGPGLSIYHRGRRPSLMGWVGVDGRSNEYFNFLYTLWVYRKCIGLLINMFNICHQLCYGF